VSDLLSHDELVELTNKTRRSAQRRVLESLRIKVTTRPDGSLIVARAHRDAALGLRNTVRAVEQAATPNFAALD
jgi:hypothetical protein